jgi:UDPglucose 6-dehydrogenase
MKITVIGTGYVGLVTGACFSEFGVDVTCVDKDPAKIEALRAGRIPIYEPGLEEIVNKNLRDGRMHFTTDIDQGIRDGLVVFIAVGTPPRGDGSADLSYVDEVARSIADNLVSYKVVVTKSTVPVGTGERIRSAIASRRPGAEFDVASNPEFLREGSAVEDFMRPNRVVVGTESEKARAVLRELYRPLYLIETPFVFTDIVTAELIKYASNAFLATKISFINEMAAICEKVGGDVVTVARAMGLDHRIGGKFLHAGPGFGGSCFPKDTRAMAEVARRVGAPARIVETVIEVNQAQQERAVEKARAAAGGSFSGKTVGLLGLAFKPNTDDFREAPSRLLLRSVVEEGGTVRAYDPAAMENARAEMGERGIVYCPDAYDALTGADLAVVMTEWNQFRLLDLDRCKELLRAPVLVDLRNVYDPAALRARGWTYHSVGRT